MRTVQQYRDERDAINIVYKRLQQDQEKADITHIIQELHGIFQFIRSGFVSSTGGFSRYRYWVKYELGVTG